ncbi:hypothetical protein HBDW_19040 [Herbaspirillum sp. DW155]|nr:hypothetical protein HBDW_19040 [Herbaspirillum sp. DW155]
MRCLDCSHCDLRSKPEMARRGFAICKFVASATYPSTTAQRDCSHFQAAAQETVTKRAAWLQAQQELFRQQII